MARLSMAIGELVADVEMPDETATALVNEYLAAYRGPVGETQRRKLRWFVRHLGNHVQTVAAEQAAAGAAEVERARVREARKAVQFVQPEDAGA
jgi:hypothetical protein